jgi:hypothetical protein
MRKAFVAVLAGLAAQWSRTGLCGYDAEDMFVFGGTTKTNIRVVRKALIAGLVSDSYQTTGYAWA